MSEFPRIVHLETEYPFSLTIHWSDGQTDTVSLHDAAFVNRSLFPLKNPTFFETARIADGGMAVAWRDGPRIEARDLKRLVEKKRSL